MKMLKPQWSQIIPFQLLLQLSSVEYQHIFEVLNLTHRTIVPEDAACQEILNDVWMQLMCPLRGNYISKLPLQILFWVSWNCSSRQLISLTVCVSSALIMIWKAARSLEQLTENLNCVELAKLCCNQRKSNSSSFPNVGNKYQSYNFKKMPIKLFCP